MMDTPKPELNTSGTDIFEQPCLQVIDEAISEEPGIVRVDMSTQHGSVSFDYDPERISDPDIVRIAQKIGPVVRERWQLCENRSKPGACENCAALLNARLPQVEQLRRATATYGDNVLSVAYDNRLFGPDGLMDETSRPAAPPAITSGWRSWWQQTRKQLTLQRIEAIFTALTLFFMLSGLIAERLEAQAGAVTLWFAAAYITGGTFGLRGGIRSLRAHTIDVDLLMVLAAIGAWIVNAPFEGALLLFLFSFSNVLQAYAMDRTRSAIKALMKMRPAEALVRRGGRTVMLPVEKLLVGDMVIVRPGENLPVDGVVVAGESAVNQAAITGESMPVSKAVGSPVLAGTINGSGGLEVRVTKRAQDSTLARMIQLVEEAQNEKAHTQRFLDTFEQYYAMGVIALTAVLVIVPVYVLHQPFDSSFYRAITVMVAASPCALVISTPASILSAIGNGARTGVLFKGGAHVESAAGVKVVAFDKTGTLTVGKPRVTDVQPLHTGDESNLLMLAAAVESRSEHPLAKAIVKAAEERGLHADEPADFQAEAGLGVRARVGERLIQIGNLRSFERFESFRQEDLLAGVTTLQEQGKTVMLVAQVEGEQVQPLGLIAVADVLRPESAAIVQELKAEGIQQVALLTGDNPVVARAIARQAGIDEVYAGLLPEDKLRIIKQLRERYGSVAMVGDGVNDAPALAAASLGIAMGAAGSDVALETADVVLMNDDLQKIPYVISLSRQTRKTLVINLSFAMFMIALMITAIFTFSLPLPLAVVGHEGGTVLVSLNGLRLLMFKRRRRVKVGEPVKVLE